MRAPDSYVEWMTQHVGFNPRAQKHSDALSGYITIDIRAHSARIDRHFASGVIVAQVNAAVAGGSAGSVSRKVDLVFREPSEPGHPGTVRLAIEHKTIMAKHSGARKNRYGDIIAFSNHLHKHSPSAIAAATVTVNVSQQYLNPDSFAREVMRSSAAFAATLEATVQLFTSIPLRQSAGDPNDLPEAMLVVLVNYDGMSAAELVTAAPAPLRGQTSHYEDFLARIDALYRARFP